MAQFLEGFPEAMIPAIFSTVPTVKTIAHTHPMSIGTESIVCIDPDVRIGFFSERGQPVLDAAAYMANPNDVLNVGMYAPLHPHLIEALGNLDGQRSVADAAALSGIEPRRLANYLGTLASAGFCYPASSVRK